MAKVELNDHQESLRKVLEEHVARLRSHFRDEEHLSFEEIQRIEAEMGAVAHELHMSIDPHPKHHGYMIENRMLEPTDPEFYEHIHPVVDLLKYLDDTSANDDPVDVTIGAEFSMKIYSRRWGHYDKYTIKRTATGWYVDHMSYKGDCDAEAEPVLYASMRHDSIVWPTGVNSLMYWVWKRAKDEGWSKNHVQEQLDRIAEYISDTERNYPDDLTL